MAELTTQELLQPSLLDRLIDDEPHLSQESRDKRVMSLRRLRAAVLRDIGWLLNTVNFYPPETLTPFPNIAASVLNYGLAELTGKTHSGVDVTILERQLRQAIWNYEPRLVRETLAVRIKIDEKHMNQHAVTLEIEGELWAEPMPLRIFMKTEVDLESGEFKIVSDL